LCTIAKVVSQSGFQFWVANHATVERLSHAACCGHAIHSGFHRSPVITTSQVSCMIRNSRKQAARDWCEMHCALLLMALSSTVGPKPLAVITKACTQASTAQPGANQFY
jgi:hypothetical protein